MSMFTPLPTPQEMGEWDRYSIQDFGIEGKILMENASREALHVLMNNFGDVKDKQVLLLAGSGNNGGDAFALGRHLFDHGADCTILHTRDKDQYKGETAYHLQLAEKAGVSFDRLSEDNLDLLQEPDIIVDGLLGTGFQGELRQDYLNWISRINKFNTSFKLAIDIPSGINGYKGTPSPDAVRADVTISFECPKLGIFMPEASKFVGKLYTPKIGIPAQIIKDQPSKCQGLTPEVFSYFPGLLETDHKSSAGHLLIIGGSPGLSGAPTLAALGALKSGAGLCTVACPKQLAQDIKQGWPEIMTLPLGPGKYLAEVSFAELRDSLSNFDAVVLGPGIGRQEVTREFMQNFLEYSERPPTLFDADALYWLAQDPESLDNLKRDDILTPHPGEMSRLNHKEISELQNARVDTAQEFADTTPGVTVLKGAGTVIAAHGEYTYISPFSCPNLAVGGSGDVLAGLIGSLKARKLGSIQAACLGVYWHGTAGEILEHHYPCRGNLAQDIAHYLPLAAASKRNSNGDKQCN